MLLVGRALQGLGFAGLQTVTRVILSDKVSLKDNAANVTLFTFLNGLGFGFGPVIGGYLTKVRTGLVRVHVVYVAADVVMAG